MQTLFIAHFNGWKGGEVILVVVDHQSVQWLISQFDQIANGSIESAGQQFVLGDGHPVESDGRCLLIVEPGQILSGSQMAQTSPDTWHWSVSRSAADTFRALLSGMLLQQACHQYLDPDNDRAPTVEVSLGEYPIDVVRRWAAES